MDNNNQPSPPRRPPPRPSSPTRKSPSCRSPAPRVGRQRLHRMPALRGSGADTACPRHGQPRDGTPVVGSVPPPTSPLPSPPSRDSRARTGVRAGLQLGWTDWRGCLGSFSLPGGIILALLLLSLGNRAIRAAWPNPSSKPRTVAAVPKTIKRRPNADHGEAAANPSTTVPVVTRHLGACLPVGCDQPPSGACTTPNTCGAELRLLRSLPVQQPHHHRDLRRERG